MPFKHNAARRHHIPRPRYRVTNWPAYEAGLRRRGDLTLWLDEAALAGWSAPTRSTPGGQPIYSDMAIELVLTLRLVFHLALRQAEAFAPSILRLLGLDLSVPAGRPWPGGHRRPATMSWQGLAFGSAHDARREICAELPMPKQTTFDESARLPGVVHSESARDSYMSLIWASYRRRDWQTASPIT